MCLISSTQNCHLYELVEKDSQTIKDNNLQEDSNKKKRLIHPDHIYIKVISICIVISQLSRAHIQLFQIVSSIIIRTLIIAHYCRINCLSKELIDIVTKWGLYIWMQSQLHTHSAPLSMIHQSWCMCKVTPFIYIYIDPAYAPIGYFAWSDEL